MIVTLVQKGNIQNSQVLVEDYIQNSQVLVEDYIQNS